MNYIDKNNFTDHPSYHLTDKINQICKPLFDNFPINYFGYMRRYQDNGFLGLIMDKTPMSWNIKGGYKIIVSGKKIHTWRSDRSAREVRDLEQLLGYYNGVLVEKELSEYIESVELASPSPYTNPLDFCYNKDLLNQFILYFKEQADDLIDVTEKELMYFPEKKFIKREAVNDLYSNFYQSTKLNKIKFGPNERKVFFTRREFETLSLLAKGKSTKEIARELQISPRTVESYLHNAKNRTNTFTVKQLLNNFTDYLF